MRQDSVVAWTLTVRAQAIVAVLSAGVLAVGVATVVQRSGETSDQGRSATPTSPPVVGESTPPADIGATPTPTATPTVPTVTPTTEPGGTDGNDGAAGGGSGSGSGGSGGGQLPGFKPKDGWPDIHGVVTDANGKPLVGIYITTESNVSDGWVREAGTVTDTHGRFRLRCQTDAQAHVAWRGVFVSVFPVSGAAPAGLPDGAWRRITPECGLADDPDVTVVLPRGADVVGTLLDQNGEPDVGTHNRIGVHCDGLPHGFIQGWAPQVSFAVDPATARFRVYGLDTDHCDLGVIAPDGTRTKLTDSIAVTEGTTVHQDVRET
ncbi:MAG: hypothetical protein QOE64_464 [Frankiales bacterium]|jgi:hypothetical protein|nr:hypothetical protein [Frankiales bacterium]